MTKVKRYHLTETGLVEGESLGRLSVVLSSDFDTLQSRLADTERQRFDEQKACVAAERLVVELQQRLTAADERADVLETALAGMLFAFDDGVGLEWSEDLLDFARKLTAAKEFKAELKPVAGRGDEPFCTICSGKKIVRMPGGKFARDCPRCCHEEG